MMNHKELADTGVAHPKEIVKENRRRNSPKTGRVEGPVI